MGLVGSPRGWSCGGGAPAGSPFRSGDLSALNVITSFPIRSGPLREASATPVSRARIYGAESVASFPPLEWLSLELSLTVMRVILRVKPRMHSQECSG